MCNVKYPIAMHLFQEYVLVRVESSEELKNTQSEHN